MPGSFSPDRSLWAVIPPQAFFSSRLRYGWTSATPAIGTVVGRLLASWRRRRIFAPARAVLDDTTLSLSDHALACSATVTLSG